MSAREWGIVRAAIDDLLLIEERIGATVAPPGEYGLLLIAVYQRVHSTRLALTTALERLGGAADGGVVRT